MGDELVLQPMNQWIHVAFKFKLIIARNEISQQNQSEINSESWPNSIQM